MFLYSVLVEVYKENLASYTYIAGGRKSLIAFSDKDGILLCWHTKTLQGIVFKD